MPFQHAQNTFISVNGVDLSTYCNESEYESTTDTEDLTTFSAGGAKVYGPSLSDGTISVSGKYNTQAGTGPRAVLKGLKGLAASVQLIRRPEGTGAGKPQDVVTVIVTSYVETTPVAGYVTWSAKFQCSGVVNQAPQ